MWFKKGGWKHFCGFVLLFLFFYNTNFMNKITVNSMIFFQLKTKKWFIACKFFFLLSTKSPYFHSPSKKKRLLCWSIYIFSCCVQAFCELCAALHAADRPPKVYTDLNRWWVTDSHCQKPHQAFAKWALYWATCLCAPKNIYPAENRKHPPPPSS